MSLLWAEACKAGGPNEREPGRRDELPPGLHALTYSNSGGRVAHIIVAVAALVLLAVVLQDAFEVMLLPRRVMRRFRLTRLYFRWAWAGWVRLARLVPPGEPRENLLSHFGALSMVGLFALWAAA